MKKSIRFLTALALFSTVSTPLLASNAPLVLSKNTVLAYTAAAGLLAGGFNYLVNAEDVTYSGKWVEIEDQTEQEKKEADAPVNQELSQDGENQAAVNQATEKENKPKKKTEYVSTREVRKCSVKERLLTALPVAGAIAGITYFYLARLTPQAVMSQGSALLEQVKPVADQYRLDKSSDAPYNQSILKRALYVDSGWRWPLNATINNMQAASANYYNGRDLINAATLVDTNLKAAGDKLIADAASHMEQIWIDLADLHEVRLKLTRY